jgi:hypothetical protein
MPKLSKAGAEKEARTLEAIADIQALADTPFRWADIARTHTINPTTLRRRYGGGASKIGRVGAGRIMTDEMESALLRTSKTLQGRSTNINPAQMRASALRLLALQAKANGEEFDGMETEDDEEEEAIDPDDSDEVEDLWPEGIEVETFKPPLGGGTKLGKNWVKRFIERKKLFVVKQKSMEANRVVGADIEILEKHFVALKSALEFYNVQVSA